MKKPQENGIKIDIERLARQKAAALARNTALGLTGLDADDIYLEMLVTAERLKPRVADKDAKEQTLFFSRAFAIVRKTMLRQSLNALRATAPAMYARYLEEKRKGKCGTDRLQRLDEIQRQMAREEFYRRVDSTRRARRLERFEATCQRLAEDDRKLVAILLAVNASKDKAAHLLGMNPRSFDYAVFQPFARRFRRAWRQVGSRK